MKKLIIPILAVFATAFSVGSNVSSASEPVAAASFVTNPAVKTHMHDVLLAYYKVKDALIVGNSANAAASAKMMLTSLEQIDSKLLTAEELRTFTPIEEKLEDKAKHIAAAKNIDDMRKHFSPLSDDMLTFVTTLHANNGEAVYADYCPMQKAQWLSSEKAIKNPYLGKMMLTCGSVKQTIQ